MSLTPSDATDLFRQPPERFLDVGGAEVAYRRVGTGPDVLFVHGWPVHGATFRKLLPHLADHVTCHLIDLPSSGSSRFDETTPLSIGQHIETVRRVADSLGLASFSVIGHDSGGMIARHALAGDPRVRSMGLIDTEQPQGLNWRFRLFLAGRNLPGFGSTLAWLAGQPRLRRNGFVLGDAFADRALLDGEFDEFFLRPLHEDAAMRRAAIRVLRTFDDRYVHELEALHRRIEVPVQLVWGTEDRFFPLAWAEEMVATFHDAQLTAVPAAGLFSHEERPADVAAALLPVLIGQR